MKSTRRQKAIGGKKPEGNKEQKKLVIPIKFLELPKDMEEALMQTAAVLRVQTTDVPERVEFLLIECAKLEEEIKDVRNKIDSSNGNLDKLKIRDVCGISFLPSLLDGVPAKELKYLADDLKKEIGSGVIALVSVANKKCSMVVCVTSDLVEIIDAVDLVRAGSHAVGGKGGGGRPDMAQAGGPDGANAQAALDAIQNSITKNK